MLKKKVKPMYPMKLELNVHIVSHLKGVDDYEIPDVVIPNEVLNVKFDYPLSNKVVFKYEKNKGFSLRELVDNICKSYSQIYKEEKRTSKERGGRMHGMLNRNKTDGKYGIWGHDLGDLALEGLDISEDGTVNLWVGS